MKTFEADTCDEADLYENGDFRELSVVVVVVAMVIITGLRFDEVEVSWLVISIVPASSVSEFILSMSSRALKNLQMSWSTNFLSNNYLLMMPLFHFNNSIQAKEVSIHQNSLYLDILTTTIVVYDPDKHSVRI